MVEGEEIISDSVNCAEVMNNFFSDAALNLNIDRKLHTENVTVLTDHVNLAIDKYKHHPSIIKILEQCFIQATDNFCSISISDSFVLYLYQIQAADNFCSISISDTQKTCYHCKVIHLQLLQILRLSYFLDLQ